MSRRALVILVFALLVAGPVAAWGVTAASNTASACATTPAQTIADNGSPIATVPSQTACVTVTGPTETVTTTVGTTTSQPPPTTTTTAPAPTYLFDDEFNGAAGSEPSTFNAKGTATSPYKNGNGTYFEGFTNAHEDGNGHLVITAHKDAAGAWHSAWLTSKAAITGPRDVQARAMVPCGNGTWASPVWEWGYPYGSAPELEDDVIEQLGKEPTTYHATLHYAATAGAGATDQSGGPINTGVTLCNAFHTYEAKVYATHVDFYFDGTFEKSITTSQLTGISDFTVMKEAENISLNMGGWGGTIDVAGPVSMLVDYIRVAAL